MAGYETIAVERKEGVVWVTLNRPDKLNALSPTMGDELWSVVREIASNDDLRVLVITGTGRAFCAGGDIQQLLGEMEGISAVEMDQVVKRYDDFIYDLANVDKPTIAAVNGLAVGGGCHIALGCDIRIASEEARFSEAFVRIGLSGADIGGTYLLPRLVGVSRALELMYTGEMLDAQEAYRIGLVNKVVPADKLQSTAWELASRLAKGPAVSYKMTKSTMLRGLSLDMSTELELERAAQSLCMRTEDYKEGIRAFMEKRQPVYKGR